MEEKVWWRFGTIEEALEPLDEEVE